MSTTTGVRIGPAGSFTDEQGARYYPIDGKNFWSVTTALKVMSKDGLPPWAAGLTARAAFDELPRVVVASLIKPCGNTYSQCRQGRGDNAHDWRATCPTCPCGECQACMAKWLVDRHIAVKTRRADEGSRVHDFIENWVISDGQGSDHLDDIHPFIRSFLAFVEAYGLTPDSWLFSEATVVNRDEEYAGTTDGALRFRARATDLACDVVAMVLQVPKSACIKRDLFADVLVDFKTKDEGDDKPVRFFDEVALQLAPYRFAPVVRIKRLGIEEPMPATHGAMAVQLRHDAAWPRLCVADEVTYRAFLNALALYRWRVELGAASVSTRSFRVPPEPKPAAAPATTKKSTPAKKTTAAKAQPLLSSTTPDAARPLAAVAREQSATLASMRKPPGGDDPFALIPRRDPEIPF